MKVLVTGFNKFGGLLYNPTQIIVEEFENRKNSFKNFKLITCVLPTEFRNAEIEIEKLLASHSPDIVLLMGVSNAINIPTIERVALNIDDSRQPDNAGLSPQAQPIRIDGKEAYISEISIDSILANFNLEGVRCIVSNHAGTFVCNHVYYVAKHFIDINKLNTACIFLHVPFLSLESSSLSQNSNLTLVYMLDIIQQLIESLIKFRKSGF